MNTEEKIDRILELVEKLSKGGTKSASTTRGEVADAADLDGQHGDEQIRRMPSAKYWSGPSFENCNMSTCSAEFLDAFAKYKDACAYANEKEANPDKAKYIGYDRRSAARARGWAERIRAGWKSPTAKTAPDPAFDTSDDQLPF